MGCAADADSNGGAFGQAAGAGAVVEETVLRAENDEGAGHGGMSALIDLVATK